ncbi:hypothetical protein ATEG_03040 [Aspergillus terreus]|uniref:Uncharacterized protein n=1 Tax=Aspergillus terreus TaxID=33178 RepID=A0A5M3Z0E6_ASPTE|nr:hypothetical protein ATETN484_0005026100 [Aspergillus terreus]GFF16926.1 hypothetical protein ATEG_03040 [Aspergillus terreus]
MVLPQLFFARHKSSKKNKPSISEDQRPPSSSSPSPALPYYHQDYYYYYLFPNFLDPSTHLSVSPSSDPYEVVVHSFKTRQTFQVEILTSPVLGEFEIESQSLVLPFLSVLTRPRLPPA